MKFRLNAIRVISDIRKAFLQISVAEEDQDFLRFLWWEDYEKKKFEIFRNRRLVFGLTCRFLHLGRSVELPFGGNQKNADFTPDEYTRRSILSTTKKTFDPLGILCESCDNLFENNDTRELEAKNWLG
ncbi:hypothetical protein TNCV_2286861 [Trichonephila clavipes]|nr:hypothetical protein TNCV_2286861 [Trichonephila clavipes]